MTSGEIDISRGEWIAHHGEQSVDLVGLGGMGEVEQIVQTEPGASYQLSFHYANNPRPLPASAAVRVSENGGGLIKELVVTHSGSELSNMKWPRATVEFVASSSSTRISFTALSEYGDGGICIDSVELTKSEGVLDTDNDGVNNYREGKDGTDPNDPNSLHPLSKGLVGYYPLDGDANDESGYGNSGIVNGAQAALGNSGIVNTALVFDGVDDFVEVPHSEVQRQLPITISVAFKTSQSEPHINSLVSKYYNDSFSGFRLGLSNGKLEPWYLVSRQQTVFFPLLNPVNDGLWRHAVLVVDHEGGKFYLDGSLAQTSQWNGAPDAFTSSSPLYFGLYEPGWRGDAFYQGVLDNVRLYNRALSPTEVGQLYQTEAGNLDSDGDGLTDAWERGYGRYLIVEGNFTWDQAKADAEAKSGHLGTITSEAEWMVLWAICGPQWNARNYWLGATDRAQEGSWQWITGEVWNYSRWCPNEPSGVPEHELISWSDLPDQMPGWNDGSGDQLPDNFGGYILEFGYPSDPFKADTDGDGYNDKVETDAKTDPNNPASFPVPPDADNDGIPDANETNTGVYVSPTDTGTDPNNADTDGDGLSDGVETATGTYVSATNTGTDPNIPDTDGDGLSDSVETNTGVYVSAANTGTNPLNDDTSSDGITDGEAVNAQFNPLIDQRPVLNFLTQAVAAQPNRFGFYNESNVMHLGMGGLMIRKSGSAVNIDLQWQTKISLTDAWTNHGAPLPFFLNLPGSKAFIRLQATPGAP